MANLSEILTRNRTISESDERTIIEACHVPLPIINHVTSSHDDSPGISSHDDSHMTSSHDNNVSSSHNSHLTNSHDNHVTSSHNSHVTSPHDNSRVSRENNHVTFGAVDYLQSASRSLPQQQGLDVRTLDNRYNNNTEEETDVTSCGLSDHVTNDAHHVTSYSRSSEHIPPHPLYSNEQHTVLVVAAVQILTGILVLILSTLVHVSLWDNELFNSPPALWWTALMPLVLGSVGCLAATREDRKKVFAWGLCSLLVAITQTAVMGVVGNFSLALYDVWPLHSHHSGHALCQKMVGRCYCQDYYHGAYSRRVMPGVQYIHEDVVWKETGFVSCDSTAYTSVLYFSTMGALAVFSIVSLFGCGVAFSFSVCAKSTLNQFQQLEQDEDEEEDEGIEPDLHVANIQVTQSMSTV